MKITEITEEIKLDFMKTEEMNRFDLSTMSGLLTSVTEEMFNIVVDDRTCKIKVEDYRVTYEEFMLFNDSITIMNVSMQKTVQGIYVYSIMFEHPGGVEQSFFYVE